MAPVAGDPNTEHPAAAGSRTEVSTARLAGPLRPVCRPLCMQLPMCTADGGNLRLSGVKVELWKHTWNRACSLWLRSDCESGMCRLSGEPDGSR